MNFLGHSNALIFDLRQNGGGSPEMIAYLSSYLFEEPVHLNSFYNRPTETTTETWTQKEVPGKKFSPETQIFVLTSSNTFSGAEEFSYNLKNLKRGTIVGETTGGGAHPVMPVVLGRPHAYHDAICAGDQSDHRNKLGRRRRQTGCGGFSRLGLGQSNRVGQRRPVKLASNAVRANGENGNGQMSTSDELGPGSGGPDGRGIVWNAAKVGYEN